MKLTIYFLSLLLVGQVHAQNWPAKPTDPAHPGSTVYSHSLFHETIKVKDRDVEFFAPADFSQSSQKLSVVVFGHGQATPVSGYQSTLEHLAQKGVAVIFPQYDSGFFDQDWRRMASDYVRLTAEVFKKYETSLDRKKVIFSGHSKGGYIAIMAAGLPADQMVLNPASVVLFDPAGYDVEYLQKMDPRIPVTLTWADKDTVIKQSLVREIYDKLPSIRKQLITVRSYPNLNPDLPADHFFSLSKKFFFGGRDGVTPFHYYGTWKWLLGAAWDLDAGGLVNNAYIYGDQIGSTGQPGQEHSILKNW